jgi:predicted MPP superfamily phosphohydrolase
MRRHFLDVRLEEKEWFFKNLPAAFEGFRLLHLTDLHCDLEPELIDRVIDLVRQAPRDAALLTGDYRNGMEGDHACATCGMARLREVLPKECWAILGNHDPLEMALDLEREGLPILLNEVAEIRRGAESLWIAGVDDPRLLPDPRSRSDAPQSPRGCICDPPVSRSREHTQKRPVSDSRSN